MAPNKAFEIDQGISESIQNSNENKLSDSTASISSSDSGNDLSCSRIEDDFEMDLLRSSTDDLLEWTLRESGNTDSQQRKKSVRFSAVQTREYNVVDELPSPQAGEDEVPRRTLGWSYSESEIDIEQHLQELVVLKKERYARLIHEHILRAEKEREKKGQLKRNGWKAKLKKAVKTVGKSMLEAAQRSNYMMAAAPL